MPSGSYVAATRHPWSCLIFVLPMLAAYELGVLLLGTEHPDSVRNGADVWLRWFLGSLGLPHLYSFGNLAFFDCGGVRLFLSEGEAQAAASVLYFRVDDIHAAHAGLAARGAKFTHAPHMIHRHEDGTEEWMAFLEDPDGRPLAIMAQVRA